MAASAVPGNPTERGGPGPESPTRGTPLVTVVTVTHERPARTRELLRSLSPIGFDLLAGVVLVDDSVAPPDYAGEFPTVAVEHVRLAGRRFISEAKNFGLARVKSEFAYFVDDDNVLTREAIEHPLSVLRADPRVGAVMPSVVYRARPDLVWVYATPFREDRWGFELLGRDKPRDPRWEGRLLPTDALPNASVVRTEAARAVGGFDPSLSVNSSADFCARLKRAGWEVWADSHVRLQHDVEPPTTRGYWAAHSVDGVRLEREVHDWFLYFRRIHASARALPARALWHALPFLGEQELAFLLRSDAELIPLTVAATRGVVSGLREPLGTGYEAAVPARSNAGRS